MGSRAKSWLVGHCGNWVRAGRRPRGEHFGDGGMAGRAEEEGKWGYARSRQPGPPLSPNQCGRAAPTCAHPNVRGSPLPYLGPIAIAYAPQLLFPINVASREAAFPPDL